MYHNVSLTDVVFLIVLLIYVSSDTGYNIVQLREGYIMYV